MHVRGNPSRRLALFMTIRSLRLLVVVLVALPFASAAAAAQSNQSAELQQLRSDLQRALVRIELLERLVLAGSTSAAATQAAPPRSLGSPSVVDEPPSEASTMRRMAPAAVSSGYIRGPKGGCYTFTASGRKKYVDHSFCGG